MRFVLSLNWTFRCSPPPLDCWLDSDCHSMLAPESCRWWPSATTAQEPDSPECLHRRLSDCFHFSDIGNEWLLEAKLKVSFPTFPRHSCGFVVRRLRVFCRQSAQENEVKSGWWVRRRRCHSVPTTPADGSQANRFALFTSPRNSARRRPRA